MKMAKKRDVHIVFHSILAKKELDEVDNGIGVRTV